MKLVDHAGLMAEPVGTIFQEFGKSGLGMPQVFGGRAEVDYVTAQLLPEENTVSVFGDNRDLFAKHGVSEEDYAIWYPSGFGRDGLFDETRHYLIWEQADRERIAAWLLDPVKAVAEMNDDPLALLRVDWNIRACNVEDKGDA